MAFITKHWFKLTLFALVAIFGSYLLIDRLGEGDSGFRDGGEAPAFELQDYDGGTVSLKDGADKVRLVYFYFSSCPDVCLSTTNKLVEVQTKLKADKLFANKAMMYSISFDPKRDTAARLKQFSEAYGVDKSGWSFLRGEEQASLDLAKKYGIMVVQDGDNFIHSNRITLIDRAGNIRQSYNGDDVTADQIVRDVARLSK